MSNSSSLYSPSFAESAPLKLSPSSTGSSAFSPVKNTASTSGGNGMGEVGGGTRPRPNWATSKVPRRYIPPFVLQYAEYSPTDTDQPQDLHTVFSISICREERGVGNRQTFRLAAQPLFWQQLQLGVLPALHRSSSQSVNLPFESLGFCLLGALGIRVPARVDSSRAARHHALDEYGASMVAV